LKRKMLFLVLITIAIIAIYVYLRPVKPLLSVGNVYNASEVGSTVLVNVTLSNVPSCSTWGLNITWDPYYLRLTRGAPAFEGGPPLEAREGEFFAAKNSTTFLYFGSINLVKGEIVVVDIFTTAGVYAIGSGVIFTLNFTILRVGTSAVELNPPTESLSQSAIGDKDNKDVDHYEVNGIITKDGPPPMWASTDFQTMLIYGELGTLGLASLLVYVYVNPKPPRSVKRRADFQPTIDPQDQE
jgi:hypothetical protein